MRDEDRKEDLPTPNSEPEPADGAEAAASGQSDAGKTRFVGTGFYWPVVAGMLLAAAIVVLVFQNTDSVRVEWLWLAAEAPLVVIVLVTILVTGLFTEIFGWVWRRRRRQALSDREELSRLRS